MFVGESANVRIPDFGGLRLTYESPPRPEQPRRVWPGFAILFERSGGSEEVVAVFDQRVYDWLDEDRIGNSGLSTSLERWIVKQKRLDNPALFKQASPFYRVTPSAPPFFVLHGTNDVLATVEQARAFVQRLEGRSNQPVAYAELPLAQHAFDFFSSLRATYSALAVERFLNTIYGEYKQTG